MTIEPEDQGHMHARAAKEKFDLAEDCLAHFEAALRAKQYLDGDIEAIRSSAADMRNRVLQYGGLAGHRIEGRSRVPVAQRTEHTAPRREFLIFLDECGVHDLRPNNDPFPVFCLCAVIVDREAYPRFDRLWKTWKADWLGSQRILVHEPDVRRRSREFHAKHAAAEQALFASLHGALESLDFTCIAAAIDKRRFAESFPSFKVDDFLPDSCYLMCLDFVLERAAHYLFHQGGDALGMVTAESRGLLEDAQVHAEFLRWHVHGTQFLAAQFFRNQFRPFVEFRKKQANSSGLQIADLAARPLAEKAISMSVSPERWDVFTEKLYDGGKGRKESYGLKVFPKWIEEEVQSSDK